MNFIQIRTHQLQIISTTFMVVFFSSFAFGQTLVSDDIRKSFNEYKAAVLATDGNKAALYVDKNTLTYYDNILNQALVADSMAIDQMDMIDKVVVLMIRQKTTVQELEPMNGKSLFVFAVDNGLVGKNSVQNNSIGKIELDGESAKGTLVSGGTPTQSAFDFHLEDGFWKIDLTSIFPQAEEAFKAIVKRSRETENDYAMMVIEFATNEKTKQNIWQPLKK